MRDRPLVSVVIPVHNEQGFLGPCLEAVLAQEEPVHEIIVVDNNSTDRTGDVLDAYRESLVILREPRQGVQHARNAGMDAATGDLIGRIDADTRLPPGWSRRVRERLEDAGVHAVTGPATYYDVLFGWLLGHADRRRDYRAYLLMTEAGYRRHRRLVGAGSHVRAWLTTRLLLAVHLPLRLLYAAHPASAPVARKNPMA